MSNNHLHVAYLTPAAYIQRWIFRYSIRSWYNLVKKMDQNPKTLLSSSMNITMPWLLLQYSLLLYTQTTITILVLYLPILVQLYQGSWVLLIETCSDVPTCALLWPYPAVEYLQWCTQLMAFQHLWPLK